jgi:hypothetical protein
MPYLHRRTACRALSAAALLGFACFLVAGCGGSNSGKTSEVDGKLLYKGKPVTGGVIVLFYDDGSSYPGALNGTDGTFKLTNLPAGKATVTVDTAGVKGGAGGPAITLPPGQALPASMKEMMAKYPKGEGATVNQGTYVEIPRKYATKATSPLHWDIAAGENHKGDVELPP